MRIQLLFAQTQLVSSAGPAGGPVNALVVDPIDSGTLYVAANFGV